jgi:hypothetical protein
MEIGGYVKRLTVGERLDGAGVRMVKERSLLDTTYSAVPTATAATAT